MGQNFRIKIVKKYWKKNSKIYEKMFKTNIVKFWKKKYIQNFKQKFEENVF